MDQTDWSGLLGQAAVVLLGVLVIAGVIIAVIASYRAEQRRIQALRDLAAARSLNFHQDDPFNLPEVYAATSFCSEGHDKKASNVIEGRVGDCMVRWFDYEYTITVTRTQVLPGGGSRTVEEDETNYKSGCATHTALRLKRLFVRHETFLDRAAALVGFSGIELDSAEFNKRFHVACDDKKFAYDVLHQKAMEFLLERPNLTIESNGDFFLFTLGDEQLNPQQAASLIDAATGFCALLPRYLKEDAR